MKEINEPFIIEIHEMVKNWVSLSTIKSWTKKYPEQQIRNGVGYTLRQIKEGKEIKEVGGYLQAMVKKEDFIDSKQTKKNAFVEKKKKKDESQQVKLQLEDTLKMLQLKYIKADDKIISKLLKGNPELKKEIIEVVKTSRFSQYNKILSEEENMKSPMVRAAYRNAVKKQFPNLFDEVKLAYEANIKYLKIQLSKM